MVMSSYMVWIQSIRIIRLVKCLIFALFFYQVN